MDAKRILFFPLSNVLGHLTRTLALAEEFDAQGHQVFVATDGSYADLTKVVRPGIRLLSTPEMFADTTRSFGAIEHFAGDAASDLANLESTSRLTDSELRRRGGRLAMMIRRDAELIDEVRPDAVITDYRFTAEMLRNRLSEPPFHISHLLGYPSLFRRLKGDYFFPLTRGRILVPGIRSIEYGNGDGACRDPERRETSCGVFRWRGWSRLVGDQPPPPSADLFLFFGSTGNGPRIVPWLLKTLPSRYRVSVIGSGQDDEGRRPDTYFAPHGDLERFLTRSDLIFCHGGHGTVMECIVHRTPMVIFPYNIEQLEIGRWVERAGLGVVVKRRYDRLDTAELGELVERIRDDTRMRDNLEHYRTLLMRRDGPKRAVCAVVRALSSRSHRSAP